MYGQNTISSPNASASRMYRIEVQGMRKDSDSTNYPLRESGNVFITVPYSRMNQQMQSINRMGGKIVNIEPLSYESAGQVQTTNNS